MLRNRGPGRWWLCARYGFRGFYQRSLGKLCSLCSPSPLDPVVLLRLPIITSNFTGHWYGHVTKKSNLQTFPHSIHSAWWIWRERGALPLRSWTRKSVSWPLSLLPHWPSLPIAGENEMETIRTERRICKGKSMSMSTPYLFSIDPELPLGP